MTHAKLPRLSAQSRLTTPLGPLTIAVTELGLAGLWFDGQSHHPGVLTAPVDDRHRFIVQARDALRRYWAGDASEPFGVPLDLLGTPFQRAVWMALQHIAPGTTRTYAEIAELAGAPAAVRAAGAAIGRNPVSVIVPCHRVVGRDGSLTGYAGGLDRKRALLALEGAVPAGSRNEELFA
ncbi:methylated-DNA--[protein]-cysteine S-methyltransferase [Aquincola sp. MAHUQ-54]|uniref:Methylated-DNA--protein-cysteine methyltransferase n=1 Tax=Aquincola agrisoli TaxID=3119538 RepID=A0AAW9Q2X8_9BURK